MKSSPHSRTLHLKKSRRCTIPSVIQAAISAACHSTFLLLFWRLDLELELDRLRSLASNPPPRSFRSTLRFSCSLQTAKVCGGGDGGGGCIISLQLREAAAAGAGVEKASGHLCYPSRASERANKAAFFLGLATRVESLEWVESLFWLNSHFLTRVRLESESNYSKTNDFEANYSKKWLNINQKHLIGTQEVNQPNLNNLKANLLWNHVHVLGAYANGCMQDTSLLNASLIIGVIFHFLMMDLAIVCKQVALIDISVKYHHNLLQ